MRLYYFPNACSLGIHVLLEETGQPFELEKVDLMAGAQHQPDYAAINPKGKVPALLRDDGGLVTEFPAIAFYLGRKFDLLPGDIDGQTKALEILDYLIATIHMRGFTRLFRPGMFAPNPADEAAVRETGKNIILQAFKNLEPELAGKDYILGEFSAVDCALFLLEFWAASRAMLPLPPALAAHLTRMLARPAVQRALASEGLA